MTPEIVELDIAVVGGGIAGLWLLNRLWQRGYRASLFETEALGSHQTVASQGMIHGGMKYTLSGALSPASEAIADMPAHWRACLEGKGDIDLRRARILSDHFYMWSSGSVTSRLTTFFASKATRGRVEPVEPAQRPEIFRQPDFNGALYRLVDMVLDVPSAVAALAEPVSGRLFKLSGERDHWQRDGKDMAELHIHSGAEPLLVRAKRFVFSAGKGNGALLEALGIPNPQMQLRPLQQVMVKHNYPHHFYGHCLGADKTPRLTISSHPTADGEQVWYLGGSLAEKGAVESAVQVIAKAKAELTELMPWVDLTTARWAALPIDRAEPRQRNFARPDKAFAGRAEGVGNVIVAWPTKLTLAPNMANAVLNLLEDDKITPSGVGDCGALSALPAPPLAPAPWELAFGN